MQTKIVKLLVEKKQKQQRNILNKCNGERTTQKSAKTTFSSTNLKSMTTPEDPSKEINSKTATASDISRWTKLSVSSKKQRDEKRPGRTISLWIFEMLNAENLEFVLLS